MDQAGRLVIMPIAVNILFSTQNELGRWEPAQIIDHLQFHDGVDPHSFRRRLDPHNAAQLEQVPPAQRDSMYIGAMAQGSIQLPNSNSGSTSFTNQDGSENQTYTMIHRERHNWTIIQKRCLPKFTRGASSN